MYHISHEFCPHTVSLYWRYSYPLRRNYRISRLEYYRDNHYHALYYPRIRGIFSQSSHRRTIVETTDADSFPDTLYRRTLHGSYRIFHRSPPLPPHRRTLRIYRKLGGKDATEILLTNYNIYDMKLWRYNISPCMGFQCTNKADSFACQHLSVFTETES